MFLAAIPPKTLEVIRHRAGARRTVSPNGHRVFCRTIRSGTRLDDPEVAVDRLLQPHVAAAELLRVSAGP